MNVQQILRSMLATLVLTCTARAAEYEAHIFSGPDGKTQPYRLLKPDHDDKGKRYPLMLLLHGYGERGTDNEKPIKTGSSGAALFLKDHVRERFPCFVLVPQAPGTWVSEPDFNVNTPFRERPNDSILLAGLTIQALMKKFPIDPDRIYVMGYSNGGCGTWDLLVRSPKFFAAAVVISGAGDPARIAVARHVPIWVFHGAKDKTVPVARGQDMVAALKKAGGHPIYTEFPSAGHGDTPTKAHREPDLLPWLFAQRRGKPAVDISELKSEGSTTSPVESKDPKSETAQGWQSLFDGKSLDGWKESGGAKAWSVEDHAIVAHGPHGMLFYTAENLRDFELKLSVKCDEGANSGVFFRSSYSEEKWPSGYEVQINEGAKDPQQTGSLLNIVKVEKRLVPAQAWFTLHVIAQGKRILVKLNGQTVVSVDDDRYEGNLIGLQSHTGIVRFKNISMKRL